MRTPLLDRPDLVDAVGVIRLPDADGESIQRWLYAQEPQFGRESWFGRMVDAVKRGDWDYAWKTAYYARFGLYMRALTRATSPEEKAAIMALVKRASTTTPEQR